MRIIENEGLADSKEQAIEKLCERLFQEGNISSVEKFRAEILKREAEASTDLTPDISMPHAKADSVLIPAVATMKTRENKRVFLVASNSDSQHIKTLAELAQALLNEL